LKKPENNLDWKPDKETMTNLEVVCHVLVSDTIITYLLKTQAA